MNPDLNLDDIPVQYMAKPERRYCIKLYMTLSVERCRAILFHDLTWDEAEAHYERINRVLGHQDVDGELVVLGGVLPYVLVDDE